MTDYIKREDVIKAIESLQSFLIYSESAGKRGTMYSAYDIGKAIEMIPSADVVEQKTEYACAPSVWTDDEPPTYVLQKHGKWERHDDGIFVYWLCSECQQYPWYDDEDLPNYCPYCGADMRGDAENA